MVNLDGKQGKLDNFLLLPPKICSTKRRAALLFGIRPFLTTTFQLHFIPFCNIDDNGNTTTDETTMERLFFWYWTFVLGLNTGWDDSGLPFEHTHAHEDF